MSFSAKNGNLKLGSIHSCTLVVKFNLIQLKRCPNTNTLTPTSLLQDGPSPQHPTPRHPQAASCGLASQVQISDRIELGSKEGMQGEGGRGLGNNGGIKGEGNKGT